MSLTRDLLHAAHYYLSGRRGLLILAGLAVIAGLVLNWSWLVAAGIAPILISVLPCVAMCALGLCMNKASGKSCSTGASTLEAAARATDEPPTVRPSTLDASPGPRSGPLSSGAGGAPISNPEPQPLKERNMTDA